MRLKGKLWTNECTFTPRINSVSLLLIGHGTRFFNTQLPNTAEAIAQGIGLSCIE